MIPSSEIFSIQAADFGALTQKIDRLLTEQPILKTALGHRIMIQQKSSPASQRDEYCLRLSTLYHPAQSSQVILESRTAVHRVSQQPPLQSDTQKENLITRQHVNRMLGLQYRQFHLPENDQALDWGTVLEICKNVELAKSQKLLHRKRFRYLFNQFYSSHPFSASFQEDIKSFNMRILSQVHLVFKRLLFDEYKKCYSSVISNFKYSAFDSTQSIPATLLENQVRMRVRDQLQPMALQLWKKWKDQGSLECLQRIQEALNQNSWWREVFEDGGFYCFLEDQAGGLSKLGCQAHQILLPKLVVQMVNIALINPRLVSTHEQRKTLALQTVMDIRDQAIRLSQMDLKKQVIGWQPQEQSGEERKLERSGNLASTVQSAWPLVPLSLNPAQNAEEAFQIFFQSSLERVICFYTAVNVLSEQEIQQLMKVYYPVIRKLYQQSPQRDTLDQRIDQEIRLLTLLPMRVDHGDIESLKKEWEALKAKNRPIRLTALASGNSSFKDVHTAGSPGPAAQLNAVAIECLLNQRAQTQAIENTILPPHLSGMLQIEALPLPWWKRLIQWLIHWFLSSPPPSWTLPDLVEQVKHSQVIKTKITEMLQETEWQATFKELVPLTEQVQFVICHPLFLSSFQEYILLHHQGTLPPENEDLDLYFYDPNHNKGLWRDQAYHQRLWGNVLEFIFMEALDVRDEAFKETVRTAYELNLEDELPEFELKKLRFMGMEAYWRYIHENPQDRFENADAIRQCLQLWFRRRYQQIHAQSQAAIDQVKNSINQKISDSKSRALLQYSTFHPLSPQEVLGAVRDFWITDLIVER